MDISNPPRPADVAARIARVERYGLPGQLELVTDDRDWSCLKITPGPGFVHLVDAPVLLAFEAAGWHYHVTLGTRVPQEVLAEVAARWHGAVVVIEVARVNPYSYVARLAARGVGGCPWVLRAIEVADSGRAWFGPHISM